METGGKAGMGRIELHPERVEFQLPVVHPCGFMGLMSRGEAAAGGLKRDP